EPAYEEPPITEQFTAEATMASWAGPLREWMYVRGQAPRLYLTKRTFYDDVELSMLLPALREDTEFGVVLCTGPEALDRAARLRLTPGATAGEVKVVLTRGATTLHEGGAAIVPESTDNVLRFGRRGPHLYVVVGDALVCQVKDPDPARGIRVGLQVQNAYVRLTRTQLKAANVCDYTFSRAPTDWYQQRGTWASTDRWPCQRGWAWLAGTQDVVPMLWTKRAFTGDMTVEVWSAMVMDLPRTPGYSHPSDVNVSICGNGRDVSSGYSFIYAGLNNTASMVMRGSQLIAKNESMRFIDPVSSNPNFHRHWFHSRIEKRGSHISYHVDGRLVAEFDDPEALEGGHVALWTTNNNGLIVARARISYSEGGEITPLPQLRVHGEPVLAADGGPVRIVEPVRMPLHNDFEDNVGQWRQAGRGRRAALALNALQPAEIRSSRRITTGNVTTFAFGGGRGLFPLAVGPEGVPQQVGAGTQDVVLSLDSSTQSQGKRSLRITNANTGGQFSVVAVPGAFRVGDAPVLSFDYRLPPEVKVNIHFTVNGRAHAIVFSGDESLSARRLGQIEDVVADGKWHTARFDLLAALADVYPATADLEIRGLGFASRSTDMYRVAGFGGNYWGSSYNIDNFRLGRAI
ncbi:MAG: hypothetical protein ACE5JM_05255, partial [Armatimonadota bacterium]